jgi:hypothetical protein
MFSLARNGERFGYCAKDKEGIEKVPWLVH